MVDQSPARTRHPTTSSRLPTIPTEITTRAPRPADTRLRWLSYCMFALPLVAVAGLAALETVTPALHATSPSFPLLIAFTAIGGLTATYLIGLWRTLHAVVKRERATPPGEPAPTSEPPRDPASHAGPPADALTGRTAATRSIASTDADDPVLTATHTTTTHDGKAILFHPENPDAWLAVDADATTDCTE